MPEDIRGPHQVKEVDQVIIRVMDVLVREPNVHSDSQLPEPLCGLMQLDRISTLVPIQRGSGYKEYFHAMGVEIPETSPA